MLDELCKKDKEWRKMAFHICKSKDLADDIVQDMYIKFANYQNPLNDHYVFFAIKCLFYQTKDKRYLENQFTFVELNDNLFNFDFDDYDYEADYLKELTLTKVKELPYFERELLTVTQEISQRQLARETDISFVVINQTIKKTKKQVWQEIKRIKD